MIKKLLTAEIQSFIENHQHDDPYQLSLQAKQWPDLPAKAVVEQIQSRQKAVRKIPTWVKTRGIIWPPPVSIEQCSSEATARFKASIFHGESVLDLMGGTGVDTLALSERFEKVDYVESNQYLCDLAQHNFGVLGKSHTKIHCATAESFLEKCTDKYNLIFADPSRRREAARVFKIEDLSPNLHHILPKCLKIAGQVLVKLSPLADLNQLMRQLNPLGIWVVAVQQEVKEVLCLLSDRQELPRISAIVLDRHGNIQSSFDFNERDEVDAKSAFSSPLSYLYEPHNAILKAGAFKLIGKRFALKKLHQHSHLYTSDQLVRDFPGKVLIPEKVLKNDKKAVRKAVPNGKVNVLVRNFPLSTTQIKSRFHLKDGGDRFLVATTIHDGRKALLLCSRATTD
jgi:hypothetical protein